MNYYRGQNPTQYKITNQNSQGFVVTMMDGKSQIVLVNGESAAAIATYQQKTYSIWV
jgi:membrane-bound inhibitor of C-type lysozyme